MFTLHLSRPALIAIILFCMATISALNLNHSGTQGFTIEPLKLAPWPQSHWQSRSANNGRSWQAHWRQDASSFITIALKTDTNELKHWRLNAQNWASELKRQLAVAGPWLAQVGHIGFAISGPITQQQVVWLLAAIEQKLPLEQSSVLSTNNHYQTQPSGSAISRGSRDAQQFICVANQATFSFSVHQQTIADLEAGVTSASLSTQQWADLRKSIARDLRHQWLISEEQFDIQAQLAYHRQPPNTVAHLYQQLSEASPDDVKAWLNC